jgi:sugar phosphate isomerase/epimerase
MDSMYETRDEILASFWTLSGETEVAGRGGTETSPRDPRARIEAAGRAGYTGIGFTHQDLEFWGDRFPASELRRILDANGITMVELEMMFEWFQAGDRRRASDEVRGRMLRWAEALGAHHVKVGTDGDGPAPEEFEHTAEEFAALCRDAEQAGTRVAIEPVAPARVATPAEGLAMIEASGASNAGLIIDVWHVARAGIPYADLAEIPAERILAVELCDATLEPEGDWLDDTVDRRLPPGEGEFDVPAFVQQIMAGGYQGQYGVETLSITTRHQPLDQAAVVNYQAAVEQIRLARATLQT